MNKKFLFVLFMLVTGICSAQNFKFRPDRFSNRVVAAQIAATGSFPYTMPFTLNDKWSDMVNHPSYVGTLYEYKNVEDVIKIGIRHDTGVIVPAYKYQVALDIKCYDYANPLFPSTKSITLTIGYNPDSLKQYQDFTVYRFTGFHQIQATITSITEVSGMPASLAAYAVARNFFIESEVVVQRYDLTPQKILSDCSVPSGTKQLEVRWGLFDASSLAPCSLGTATGNDYKPITYELEWCYIDDYQYDLSTNSSSYAFSPPGNINYDFRKNSTRVQISDGVSFKIPLIYEHGAIMYRLRTLRPDNTNYKSIQYSDWTTADYGVVDATDPCFSASGYLITDAHLGDSLNWQYTINFAEEGKYKHVINYFDGSLKDRQTQTKINTDNNYIIAVDKVYDYEGRPAIVTLPTPVLGQSDLKLRNDISLHTTTGNAYRAADFDILGCTRPDSIAPLSSSARANIYYSSLNADQAGMQRFVPDAKGYPIVQTVYSPDNTNKVLWQGGAGLAQQLWQGHGTQYEYTRPTQGEIDRLLGTEVGKYEYYPKQVVTDPNGQSSYSILDPTGKVVISGLQGPNPDTSGIPIDTLANFVRGQLNCEDILNGYDQVKTSNTLSAQLPVYNDNLGDASFRYSVKITPFATGCNTQYLYAAASYAVRVTNDCGTVVASNMNTVGASKAAATSNTTYASATSTVTGMPKGNYLVNKKLSFSEYDIHHLVDSFVFANEPGCYNDVNYFVKKAIDSAIFPCQGFIDTTSNYCDMMRKLMKAQLYPGGKYGKYNKDSLGLLVEGDTNSIFYKKKKILASPPRPTDSLGFKYIARTGYYADSLLPVGAIDTNWNITMNGVDYYPDTVQFYLPSLGFEYFGTVLYMAVDPPGPPFYTRSYPRSYVNITEDIPLQKVYARGILGDHFDSLVVNGVSNLIDYNGENFDVKGFHYGWNEIICAGENDGTTPPLLQNFYSSFTCFIVGYDTTLDYAYRNSCVHLPDSVVKDGIVYKDLKDLPVETFINIFNDDIAEALLPLHPEYCKLQNCNDANFEQVLEGTDKFQLAEKNNMFYLDSLVAHDPLVLLSGGSVTASRLKYLKSRSATVSIDTLALQQAYCGAGNGEELSYCAAKDYKYEISNFIFTTDQVKQDYFSILKSLYIGNRTTIKQGKLDSTDNSCASCLSSRLKSTGTPVFTSVDAALSAGYSGAGPYDDWVKDLFRKGASGDSTGMSTPSAALNDTINKVNIFFAEAQADNLLEHLKNCSLSATVRTNMYNAALNVLKSGRKLSPDIVSSIITDTVSLSFSDLCHPFLVAYDLMPEVKAPSAAYACGNDQVYNDFLHFMQRPQVIAELQAATVLLSAGTTFGPTLSNTFESQFSSGAPIQVRTYMDGVSPVCSNCYVNFIVSSDIRRDTFHITPLQYRTMPDIKTALNSSTPVYSIAGARCINKESSAMANGLIAKNTAVLDLYCSACVGNLSYCVWSKATPFMTDAPDAASLASSLTCIDMLSALQDFKSDASAYSYSEATNHPLYEYTLTNYLNYKFNKSYYYNDYQKLMEGCAITDQVQLKKLLTTYRMEFSSDAGADAFVIALNAYGTFKPDLFRYKTTGGNPTLFIDFNTISSDTILAYKTFIDAYTTGVAAADYNYNDSHDYSLLFSFGDCSFDPSSFTGSYTTDDVSVMEDTTYNTHYKLHSFATGSSDPKDQADLFAAVENYLHSTTLVSSPTCNVGYNYYSRELLRSSDYNTDGKQDYLKYIYGFAGNAHDDVIGQIDPANLVSNLHSFNGHTCSYDDPYCQGSRTNVYAWNPTPSGKAFDRLKDVLSFIGTPFPDHDFRYISPYGSRLAVIRKANGNYWYRYFDTDNILYDFYLTPPDRQNGIPLGTFSLNLTATTAGPGGNTFFVEVTDGTNTFTCRGYTDFVLDTASLVVQDVILDKDPKGIFCVDTLDCEKDLLTRAIINGKVAYKRYFDSTVTQMSADMLAHLIKTTVDSLVYCGQKQQYQQTLYYYDLAGNLSNTVPPAGIDTIPIAILPSVKDNRNGASPDLSMTKHTKQSVYRYNSLNQLIYQHTPDGGSTYFFYDAAGRQVFSQNSRQRPDGKYSYSFYDEQGRPEESGEVTLGCTYSHIPGVDFDTTYCILSGGFFGPHPDYVLYSFNESAFPYATIKSNIRANTRQEVVWTHYDEQVKDLGAVSGEMLLTQENLRSRVSAIEYYLSVPPASDPTPMPDFTTHYSYDISGNVQHIVYDYPNLAVSNQQYKHLAYDYDLISGKVNMVSFNPGHPDQFYQQYEYDADNRITEVHTSNDGLLWNEDARYEYYKHGPLATAKIGNQKVQSLEYAYTIQGWLKAINGDVLKAENDMGFNGLSVTTTPMPAYADIAYPRDVVAHALHYFKDDYTAIGGTDPTVLPYNNNKSLYNGNIAQQTTGIGGLGTMQRTYQYDQLQRLKLGSNTAVDDDAKTLVPGPAELFRSLYTYDMDGNIKRLTRWDGTPGTPVLIDKFSYTYYADTANRLNKVSDGASPTSGTDLQPGQGTDNYVYDETGNLIHDQQSFLDISWDHFGKVTRIVNALTGTRTEFGYDGKGNRIWKDYIVPSFSMMSGFQENHNGEYYVRDAGSNLLATYRCFTANTGGLFPVTLDGDTMSLTEHHIYGSSRLGVQRYDSTSIINTMHPGPGYLPVTKLNDLVPWYSYYYADLILPGYKEPYGTGGNTYFGDWSTNRTLGHRYYEMTDHLGNVLATVLDRRTGNGSLSGGTLYDHWSADLAQVSDYYPGGMMMPGRNAEHDWSRMGSQGQQKDDEIYGKGNTYAFKYRMEDARINRFFSPDPLHSRYPHNSDYAFSENRLIDGVELEGLEWADANGNAQGPVNEDHNSNTSPFVDKQTSGFSGESLKSVVISSGYVNVGGQNINSKGQSDVIKPFKDEADASHMLNAMLVASFMEHQNEVVFDMSVAGQGMDYNGSSYLPFGNGAPQDAAIKTPVSKGGRLGNEETRSQITDIANKLNARGYTITGGGGQRAEEYLPPIGGGRKGSSYPDITATHPDYPTLRINTVDVYKSGAPTLRESKNAERIRTQIAPGEHLLLIPKRK